MAGHNLHGVLCTIELRGNGEFFTYLPSILLIFSTSLCEH